MVVLPLVSLLASINGGSLEEKHQRCRDCVRRSWVFFHDYMRILGLINYNPRNNHLDLPDGAIIVIANHPTLIDVTALGSASSRLLYVAKSAMFRSPFLGGLLRRCGHIDGGGNNLFSGAMVVTKGIEALKKGSALLIFPEGTRSPKNGLRPFRPGAFEIAYRTQTPILPLMITCFPPTLMRDQHWYEIPEHTAKLSISTLPLILPPHPVPEELIKKTEEMYKACLQQRFPKQNQSAKQAKQVLSA